MNLLIVVRILGNLLLFKSIALILPLAVSIWYKGPDIKAFIYTLLITSFVGSALSMIKAKKQIRIRESILIVVLSWLFVCLFGSLPFLFSGAIPSWIDAFFETVSGLTTTGATIIEDIEALPHGILFWRSLTHWLGGMGILVLTLAILPALGVGGFQIFKAESPGPISDKLVPKMKDTAKILYTAYLGITILQIVLLYIGGMSFFESLIHTFGTMGTGGFSSRNGSIGDYNSNYIIYVITIFMIGAGVNFSLYYDLYKGRWKGVLRNTELRWYLAITLISILMITISTRLSVYNSVSEAFKHSAFQVSSFITTTGYTTVDYEQWSHFSRGILFFLMFVGGSAGSTAGSVKIIRIIIVWKLIKREIAKLLHPRAVIPIKINNKNIQSEVVTSVCCFIFLYILIFIVGTLLISLEGLSFQSASSAVAASLGNIGPGFDFVGPTQTYSQFSTPSKLLLSLLMLFGRLEVFTLFVLMMPTFWQENWH